MEAVTPRLTEFARKKPDDDFLEMIYCRDFLPVGRQVSCLTNEIGRCYFFHQVENTDNEIRLWKKVKEAISQNSFDVF